MLSCLCALLLETFENILLSPPGLLKKVDIHTTTRSQLCVGVDDISDSEGRGTVVTWGQPTIWLFLFHHPLVNLSELCTIRKSNLWNSPVVS